MKSYFTHKYFQAYSQSELCVHINIFLYALILQLLVTPIGQKRRGGIPHLVPSPEESPEGSYIGQHSQGLGGHYAESYLKRRRLNTADKQ